jgi:transposase
VTLTMPKRKIGRPVKLTPEIRGRLCEALRDGNYYEAACAKAGVHYGSFRNWMRKGRRAKSGEFFEFFKAVREAEADAETAVVQQWRSQIPENWQAARDFLARRFPDRWGPKDKHEFGGDPRRPIRLQFEDAPEPDAGAAD